MIIVGIDPGKKGAIFALYHDGVMGAWTMPLVGKELDVHGLCALINTHFVQRGSREALHVFVEQVHAIFGSSAGSTFTFGYVCGAIQGILSAQNIPFTLVQPKVWQREIYQGIPEIRKPSVKVTKGKHQGSMRKGPRDTKAMSLLAAKRLFPEVSLLATKRCKKPHDGIVDALLISEYGRRMNNRKWD